MCPSRLLRVIRPQRRREKIFCPEWGRDDKTVELLSPRPDRNKNNAGCPRIRKIQQQNMLLLTDFKEKLRVSREGKTMIIKSRYRPGPEWYLLPVAFVISELTGVRTELANGESFWIWETGC
jgi:hypothetical protein